MISLREPVEGQCQVWGGDDTETLESRGILRWMTLEEGLAWKSCKNHGQTDDSMAGSLKRGVRAHAAEVGIYSCTS